MGSHNFLNTGSLGFDSRFGLFYYEKQMEMADRAFGAEIAQINEDIMTPLYLEYRRNLFQTEKMGHRPGSVASMMAENKPNLQILEKFRDILSPLTDVQRRTINEYPYEGHSILASDLYMVRALQASLIWIYWGRKCYEEPYFIIGRRPQTWGKKIVQELFLLSLRKSTYYSGELPGIRSVIVSNYEMETLLNIQKHLSNFPFSDKTASQMYRIRTNKFEFSPISQGSLSTKVWGTIPNQQKWTSTLLRTGEIRTFFGGSNGSPGIFPEGVSNLEMDQFEVVKYLGSLAARFGVSKQLRQLFIEDRDSFLHQKLVDKKEKKEGIRRHLPTWGKFPPDWG